MSGAATIFCVLAGLAAIQAILAVPFICVMRRSQDERTNAAPCPKAAVVLCLRGSDPFLPRCLDAIVHQDYPCYEVHIVIDSPDDPAWKIANRIAAEPRAAGAANVHIRSLTHRRQTCSLKCSSLVQAISGLDASCKVVALLDADAIPHQTWLRELVAPLVDDRVGAATGNRWYAPAYPSPGSLVRWLWNAAAVVLMYLFHIPWGGTLALKTSVIRQSDLLERWANAFCEDTMLYSVLRRLGYRVAFVPSLMMVNREACSLAGFCRWVRRQLLNARLYHPGWPAIVGHGLVTSAAQLATIVLPAAAMIAGRGSAALWLMAGIALYWAVMTTLLAVLDVSVRRASHGGTSGPGLRISRLLSPRTAAAMLLTQVLYPAMLLSAMFPRTVDWRGIRYRVRRPGKIHMIKYQPYCPSHSSDETLQSL